MWENIKNRGKNEPYLDFACNLFNGFNIEPQNTFMETHKEKPLHGQFIKKHEHIAISFKWLTSSSLTKRTISLIFAAQEQCIPTNYYKKRILKQKISENCRLCGTHPETSQHLLSGCSVLAKNQYVERHNKIGSLIYFNSLGKHGIKTNKQRHEINNVFENNDIKMKWNPTNKNKNKA